MDRLGAALRALRQTYSGQGSEADLGAKCLAVVLNSLAEEGLAPEDLAPLRALADSVQQAPRAAAAQQASGPAAAPEKPAVEAERRKRRPPSDALLARVSAVIDLLVKAGYDENEAAQAIMRRLVAVGVSPPVHGGDSRGWKRLLFWRSHLLHGSASSEARDEYGDFSQQIDQIPAAKRVETVLDENLWDRRRKVRQG